MRLRTASTRRPSKWYSSSQKRAAELRKLRTSPRECMKLQLPQALFPTSGLGYWYRAVPS